MAMATPLCMFSCVYNTKKSNFYAGSEGCELCVCGFVSVEQLSNSVSHCSNVLFHIVPQKGSCSWVYFCPCKRFRKCPFQKILWRIVQRFNFDELYKGLTLTSFERRKMPDVLYLFSTFHQSKFWSWECCHWGRTSWASLFLQFFCCLLFLFLCGL